MNQQQIIEACQKHSLYSWSATDNVVPMPVARVEGVYMYDFEGRRTLDFNSQLMSVNIGHGHPKVVRAIQEQAARLCYSHPGTATEVRAQLCLRLAELVPGDINTFFFTLGGAEANENAIRAARLYTGRQKILSRYRSYHGGTNATLQLTGDPRRLYNEPGGPGYIRVMDPQPYRYSFGETEEEITRNNLAYLEEIIEYEGPKTIAAMIIEPVVGTNGILPPPKGYLQGLRALLDKHGILLICDEVMAGWGRTGKMFAFQHGDILPDILTMAKGLTSSYLPLGCMGVRDPIAEHFRKNVFWGGLTYNAHALCMGAALAALDVLIEEGMVENAARLESVMKAEMQRLKDRHPAIKTFRAIGLFGIVETHLERYNQNHPAMSRFAKALLEKGLYTVYRWGSFMCNPPLCITEEQLHEGFAIIDTCLPILDAEMSGQQSAVSSQQRS